MIPIYTREISSISKRDSDETNPRDEFVRERVVFDRRRREDPIVQFFEVTTTVPGPRRVPERDESSDMRTAGKVTCNHGYMSKKKNKER